MESKLECLLLTMISPKVSATPTIGSGAKKLKVYRMPSVYFVCTLKKPPEPLENLHLALGRRSRIVLRLSKEQQNVSLFKSLFKNNLNSF